MAVGSLYEDLLIVYLEQSNPMAVSQNSRMFDMAPRPWTPVWKSLFDKSVL